MTPSQYAKIKAVAADERGDPATRAAAQKQIDKWRVKMEGLYPEKKLHPGMVQSDEYKRWAKAMEAGYRRGRK
jgi:hypothetical protein